MDIGDRVKWDDTILAYATAWATRDQMAALRGARGSVVGFVGNHARIKWDDSLHETVSTRYLKDAHGKR